MGVVEDVADAAAGAFGDFAGAFDGSDAGVLGSYADAFADAVDTLYGVEGDEVGGSFAGAFCYVAGGSACAFADVAGSAAYVAAGAALGSGLGLLCGCGRGRLLLGEGGWDGDEECEEDGASQGAHGLGALLLLDARGGIGRSAGNLGGAGRHPIQCSTGCTTGDDRYVL